MKLPALENDHYTWGDGCQGWHLVKTDLLSVIKEIMPPGTAERMHFHEHAKQLFYITKGVATFEVDGTLTSIGAGESIYLLNGEVHRISNRTETDLEFIVVSQPPSHGDRVDV